MDHGGRRNVLLVLDEFLNLFVKGILSSVLFLGRPLFEGSLFLGVKVSFRTLRVKEGV